MDKQPTFTERIARLKQCAYELHTIGCDGSIDMDLIAKAADTMLAEAQHMEAAAKRWSLRIPPPSTALSARCLRGIVCA